MSIVDALGMCGLLTAAVGVVVTAIGYDLCRPRLFWLGLAALAAACVLWVSCVAWAISVEAFDAPTHFTHGAAVRAARRDAEDAEQGVDRARKRLDALLAEGKE